ncbi:MAG: hypothetical protein HOC74_18365, partial [Gemmatimonadetes bacterium]|nr:hypothetical protein [Gemmatimonadota bacterium]
MNTQPVLPYVGTSLLESAIAEGLSSAPFRKVVQPFFRDLGLAGRSIDQVRERVAEELGHLGPRILVTQDDPTCVLTACMFGGRLLVLKVAVPDKTEWLFASVSPQRGHIIEWLTPPDSDAVLEFAGQAAPLARRSNGTGVRAHLHEDGSTEVVIWQEQRPPMGTSDPLWVRLDTWVSMSQDPRTVFLAADTASVDGFAVSPPPPLVSRGARCQDELKFFGGQVYLVRLVIDGVEVSIEHLPVVVAGTKKRKPDPEGAVFRTWFTEDSAGRELWSVVAWSGTGWVSLSEGSWSPEGDPIDWCALLDRCSSSPNEFIAASAAELGVTTADLLNLTKDPNSIIEVLLAPMERLDDHAAALVAGRHLRLPARIPWLMEELGESVISPDVLVQLLGWGDVESDLTTEQRAALEGSLDACVETGTLRIEGGPVRIAPTSTIYLASAAPPKEDNADQEILGAAAHKASPPCDECVAPVEPGGLHAVHIEGKEVLVCIECKDRLAQPPEEIVPPPAPLPRSGLESWQAAAPAPAPAAYEDDVVAEIHESPAACIFCDGAGLSDPVTGKVVACSACGVGAPPANPFVIPVSLPEVPPDVEAALNGLRSVIVSALRHASESGVGDIEDLRSLAARTAADLAAAVAALDVARVDLAATTAKL